MLLYFLSYPIKEKGETLNTTIPHIHLFHELDASTEPILPIIEPLYAYLYSLNTRGNKGERQKPPAFFFLLESIWKEETSLSMLVDFHNNVTCSFILVDALEKQKNDFKAFPSLFSLITTLCGLRANALDISLIIVKIKDETPLTHSKSTYKKLFLYVESVRALMEELNSLKEALLEGSMDQYNLQLTEDPLDLKGDCE